MPDQPRPVWIDETLITYLRDISGLMGPDYFRDRVRTEIVAAWDAAPSDPTEAALAAIDNGYQTDADEAAAVLRALGMPDA